MKKDGTIYKKGEKMKKKIMDKRNVNFTEFIEELDKKCNFRGQGDEMKWDCGNDHQFCKEILQNYENIDIEATIKYFEKNGGHCDCEVLFNVAKQKSPVKRL